MLVALLPAALLVSSTAATEYSHRGGGLTSAVMASVIGKLPPVKPPSGVAVHSGSELMRTVRLSGDYRADVPLVLPSYTRLILDGSIAAIPYTLRYTNESAGATQQCASMVTAKGATMVSVEGGQWTCEGWNSSKAQGDTTTVTAIYFDSTSFSFIRDVNVTRCGMYSGGNNSSDVGIGRTVSANARHASRR
jgi:hypothetical protein